MGMEKKLKTCFIVSGMQKTRRLAGGGAGGDCDREPGKRESRETMKLEGKNKRNE